jgi:hypothetical protein
MISRLSRARVYGAALALAMFALGVAVGMWHSQREQPGTNIRVTATDRMPTELQRLGLGAAQDSAVREALRRGRDRVLHVGDEIHGRMQSALDSTDAEIRVLLTPQQRASFDSARKVNGPQLREERVIHRRP